MDNNIIKRAFTLMLSMVAVSAPFAYNKANSNSIIESAYAESGESDHIKWSLEKGVLKISGSGAMSTSSLSIPWKENVNDITSVVIDSGVTSVGSFAFRNCGNLVSVTLPDTITVIERNAFKGCSSLTSINFPVGIKSIERSSFSECSALTEVSFPNTLVSIGESAFEECASLKKAIIPDSVNTIEDYAFENCNSDLLICCSFGSAAFSYAKANSHKYDDSYTFEKNPVEPTDPVNNDTFVITSGKDFKKLPDISSDYKIISLEADINAPSDWTSIVGFNGTFNGNGHKISGLTNSLFATLEKDAVVKNLTLSDVQIDISTGGSPVGVIASENIGTIKNCSVSGEVNYMSTLRMNEKITWINSAVFPNTFRYFCAGGIAGINSGTIEGCTNSAKIYISNSSSLQEDHSIYYALAGGIAAENNGSVNNCTNLGSVDSNVSSYTVMDYDSNRTHKGYSVAVSGGITGLNKGSISGCKSVGAYAFNSNFSSGKYTDSTTKDEEASYSKSPAMSAYSGGIAGAVYNGSIFQCSVSDIGETKGTLGARMYVTASKYDNNTSREVNIWCGGIAGASFGNTEIDQCSNSLNPCTGFQVTGKLDLLYENLFCGGILGAANYQNTNITNCYNTGIPTITDEFPKIEHLTNINGGFFHGGLVGAVCNCSLMGNNVIEIHKGAAKVKNCYSIAPSSRFKMDTGDVYSYNYALFNEDTQLSFVTDNATFNNCYYIDSLSGKHGTKKSESEMKSKEFASQLGEAFVYEPGSYPKLSWEKQKVKGDVNSDGYLTVADAVLLQKWLLAVPNTNLQDWKAADLCEDNKLDVFDLVLLKRELINNM